MMKEISLGDKRFFDIFIGKRVLKSQIFKSKKGVPIYSANVFSPFGFLKKSNIKDFLYDSLLWGIDGKFEFNIIKKGKKFATTDHCGTIKILDKAIIPEYLLYQLELQSHILGYDRTLRPSLSLMKKVNLFIPTNKKGNFDKDIQKEVVKKFNSIKEIKDSISNEIEDLSEITLSINIPEEQTIILKIEDIFNLKKTTNRSLFTKFFINKNKGNIPVYSASKNPNEISYGFVKDKLPNIKYFRDILTWNIDGSVGKAFFRKGKFSLSEKVIPLTLNKKWKNFIYDIYVKYVLEKKAIEKGFMFSNKAGKSRIKEIEIEIPYKLRDGKRVPDLEKQERLAEKYKQLYEIKENLIQCLQDLQETKISI